MEAIEQQKQEVREKGRKDVLEDGVNQVSKILKAMDNKKRLTILGLLYIDGERRSRELQKELQIKSNKLAYHLKVLSTAGLIRKQNYNYDLTMPGMNIMHNIGFLDKIEKIRYRSLYRKPFRNEDGSIF